MSTCQQCASMASTITALRGQLRRLKKPKRKSRFDYIAKVSAREGPRPSARPVPNRSIWTGSISGMAGDTISVGVGEYLASPPDSRLYRLDAITASGTPQWRRVYPTNLTLEPLPLPYDGEFGDLRYYPDLNVLYEWTPSFSRPFWKAVMVVVPPAAPASTLRTL
jgi:hypothetical protein